MMIKRFKALILGSLLVLCLIPAIPAFADPVTSQACNIAAGSTSSSYCQQNGSNPLVGPNGTITKVIRLVALFAGIAAVISIIIGGFMYVASGGDPNSVKTARSTIIYAAIGLVVIAAAQAILTFVLGKL